MARIRTIYEEDTKTTPLKDLRFTPYSSLVGDLVLIKWLINGNRWEERVPLTIARHRKIELESQGAIVYWSERVIRSL